MNARDQLCSSTIVLVIFKQLLSSLLVERRLGVRVDEQALDRDEDVADAVRRLPVLLERVHANLTGRRHVRMENLADKPTCSRLSDSTTSLRGR